MDPHPWPLPQVVDAARLRSSKPVDPGATYLLPYKVEVYPRIALRLKLWPNPRGHHRHVASIPFRQAGVGAVGVG